jgi:hypothetical protein
MKTFKDFDSREEFVRSLNLFHNDLDKKQKEFNVVHGLCNQNFVPELNNIKKNLDFVQTHWNNQSIEHIEASVSQYGVSQMEIMQGQKNDKVRAGYLPSMPMYRVNQCNNNSVFYQLAESLGLTHSVARYHVQFPGEVTAMHTDIFSPAHEFLPDVVKNIPDSKIGHDNNVRRILIALEDWRWGQTLMFGATSWVQWKAGDIAYWNYGVPHGAANMGYSPRITASITGLATDKFFEIFNYESNVS